MISSQILYSNPASIEFTPENINGSIKDMPGVPVAFALSETKRGLEVLAANNCAVARMINSKTLNTSISAFGPMATRTLAYELSFDEMGCEILTVLVHKITPETLNSSNSFNDSLALKLASTKYGQKVLAANDYALAKLIAPKMLGRISSALFNANQERDVQRMRPL